MHTNKIFKSLKEIKETYFPHIDIDILEGRREMTPQEFEDALKKLKNKNGNLDEQKRISG